jgi:hypothetical protein
LYNFLRGNREIEASGVLSGELSVELAKERLLCGLVCRTLIEEFVVEL